MEGERERREKQRRGKEIKTEPATKRQKKDRLRERECGLSHGQTPGRLRVSLCPPYKDTQRASGWKRVTQGGATAALPSSACGSVNTKLFPWMGRDPRKNES